ncbi:hypothetical protein CROQUDRAFT_88939 [Cronartium quercuum f. sp. fusiforme G11]|uniref:Uncharacterized protein n=1 Tax=Cronartium quercuum f. sp. fusiforme G11 TaxID=708437 RepID=A0A9P6TEJ3_9BASI|nr:hypothetical protein CROQUDRAFT_88939 [Cronartium quercuum f. sp. fusiforme G11]
MATTHLFPCDISQYSSLNCDIQLTPATSCPRIWTLRPHSTQLHSTCPLPTNQHNNPIPPIRYHKVLPTGIPKLPPNLGEAKQGSLKAAQWHSLFAYVIPLIVVDVYVGKVDQLKKDSNQGRIIFNIACLVQCTNIVCAKKVSEYEALMFEKTYRQYHKTSQQIFKDLVILLNHHYTMHIPDQIRQWGPLASVAEFAGERLIAQMDNTMMSRFSQWQRLLGNHLVVETIGNPSKEEPRDP